VHDIGTGVDATSKAQSDGHDDDIRFEYLPEDRLHLDPPVRPLGLLACPLSPLGLAISCLSRNAPIGLGARVFRRLLGSVTARDEANIGDESLPELKPGDALKSSLRLDADLPTIDVEDCLAAGRHRRGLKPYST
jgi:hypothetical protein